MLTMYATKVLTNDQYLLDAARRGDCVVTPVHQDVRLCRDYYGKEPVCQYRWDNARKPTKRNKYVTINCFKYLLEWVN